ncbi:VWA domain-containing protein [Georgenia sp. 10Sc9-8]|uniref:VWA domain-containing protein n=1 Tax=Georgenia halotolerans TaxID=3028317 RepID=A0ABT5TZA7_9MICO|nr:VWA domain-containing protein [Georgenia halotolerans]
MEADSPVQRRSQDPDRRSGLKPLRRKPKELDSDPTLFQPTGGSGGMVLSSAGPRRDRPGGPEQGSTAPGVTDEPAELLAETPQEERVDAETLRRAQEIAAQLAVARPPRDASARRGLGDITTVPYRGTSADIDMDATVEALVANPVPEPEDIVVRERLRTRRSVVLAIDVSGSMRGERVRTAAATVGALAAELVRDDLAVIAFWSDAALLLPMGEHVEARTLLETLVRIPARGLTNVAFPLELAQQQLSGVSSADSRVLLLSDCVHNAGPDPRTAVGGLPRLDVLLDTSGEQDPDLARDLAQLGRGRLELLRGYRDVAPAVSRLFSP